MSSNAEALAVAQLIDELRADDLAVRLTAFGKLDRIAEALGTRRTREELVPYLSEFVDDEDEILLVLAQGLGKLTQLAGGPKHASVLLPPLEVLCRTGEAAVREMAVQSVVCIVQQLERDAVTAHVYPLFTSLARGEWFTSRVSAASLCAVLYPLLPGAEQQETLKVFGDLSRDETPMVRRAACTAIKALLPHLPFEEVQAVLNPALAALAGDEQDSVRLVSTEACVAVMRVMEAAGNSDCRPVHLDLCCDKSWRVRYMVATHFPGVIRAYGGAVDQHARDSGFEDLSQLLEDYCKLLADNEPEVRTSAALQLAAVAEAVQAVCSPNPRSSNSTSSKEKLNAPSSPITRLLPSPPLAGRTLQPKVAPATAASLIADRLIPRIAMLCQDSCQYTRAALGSVVASLAPLLDSKEVVVNQLLPVFLSLLKDPDPEVRLNIISEISGVNEVVGVDLLLQSLLPAIQSLAQDEKWRVRLAIIQRIADLAERLGPSFLQEQMSGLCLRWLCDSVFSIRVAATASLARLCKAFGQEWTKNNVVPHVVALSTDSSYLLRMTALFAITEISVALDTAAATNTLLPLILQMGADPVANVRFNVAKALAREWGKFDAGQEATQQVKPLLRRLCADDPDADVRYYAHIAMEVVEGRTPALTTAMTLSMTTEDEMITTDP